MSAVWAARSPQQNSPSSSRVHDNQAVSMNNGQQGQGMYANPSGSAIKRPASTGNLGSNKRVRIDPPETLSASYSFGTGSNAFPPVFSLNAPAHFGVTTHIGGTAWHSGPPPSTLSTQMLTQWNHQPTQVPGTLGQTLNAQIQRPPSAAIETQAKEPLSNLQPTAGNSSGSQAQMHRFQSNPWKTQLLTQQNSEGQGPRGYWRLKTSDEHAGVETQTQQPNRAQMQNHTDVGIVIADVRGEQQQQQSDPPGTTSNEMGGSVQQLEGRLATERRELEVQLLQELDINQRIQKTLEPAPVPPQDEAFSTSVQDLQSRVAELEKVLKESREKVNIVQGTLGVAQRGRKKASDELAEERKRRVEVEERLSAERARVAQMNEELQKERTLRVEAEAQLQSERKGREEEVLKEKVLRLQVEGDLLRERQGRAGIDADLQQERRLRAEVDVQLQKERKGRAEMEAESAQASGQVDIEMGELKQEDPWDQLEDERKRRVKLEERLGEEQRRRAEAEHLLRDVERECRAPFVVPALLEAFSTISRITSRSLEANAISS
ncbi:hypothetical protein APHAL10511_004021 [Amanita phalloides]|nr:hypothetical protein APHAL10511_004021 [Amanita phalloides]